MNTETQNVEMQGTDPFIFILLTPLSFTETQNVDMQGTDPFTPVRFTVCTAVASGLVLSQSRQG